MSDAQEKARIRRERLLAKAEERMKFAAGEIKSLDVVDTPPVPSAVLVDEQTTPSKPVEDAKSGDAEPAQPGSPSAEPKQAPVTSTPTQDTRPKWERAREQNLSAVKEKREISEETLKQLEVTEKMAVEAPRAEDTLSGKRPKRVFKAPSVLSNIKLDSLLTSVFVLILGYLSGTSNGVFVSDNVWLPFGSLLFFALLLRVILSVSLQKVGLVRPVASNAGGGGMLDMAMGFIPAPFKDVISKFRMASGYFKDSYDDMMLFVFAHGLSSRLIAQQQLT